MNDFVNLFGFIVCNKVFMALIIQYLNDAVRN